MLGRANSNSSTVKFFSFITKSTTGRSIGILASGTAIAQAISVLILPVLTRLYEPHEFSILAVYVALSTMLSVVACLRLEIGIPIPEDDATAVSLLVLCLISAAIFSAAAGGAVWMFGPTIASGLGQPKLQPYLWLLPLTLWLSASFTAFQLWATRKREFGAITIARVSQSAGGAVTQVAAGYAHIGAIGLIVGYAIMGGAGGLILINNCMQRNREALRSLNISRLRSSFREYIRFPKYSTIEALANAAATQVPVLIIAATAVGAEAGYLLLATRILSAPLSLIGGAIAQVYLSQAAAKMRSGGLGELTGTVLRRLTILGVGPLIFLAISAPSLLPLVLGPAWVRTGEIIAWMVPWIALQLLSSPTSMALHVTNRQRLALVLQLFGLGLRVGVVSLAAVASPGRIVEAYAISGALFYAIYLVVIIKVSGTEAVSIR